MTMIAVCYAAVFDCIVTSTAGEPGSEWPSGVVEKVDALKSCKGLALIMFRWNRIVLGTLVEDDCQERDSSSIGSSQIELRAASWPLLGIRPDHSCEETFS